MTEGLNRLHTILKRAQVEYLNADNIFRKPSDLKWIDSDHAHTSDFLFGVPLVNCLLFVSNCCN